MTNQITFRIVRAEYKQVPQYMTPSFPHTVRTFVADPAGDWVEKDYGNGSRAYRMAIDCNANAVRKLRAA
jgi:hypothetical protein